GVWCTAGEWRRILTPSAQDDNLGTEGGEAGGPAAGTLVGGGGVEKGLLAEGGADHLEADRQALRETAGDAEAGEAGQVDGQGADVGKVHGKGVGGLRSEREGNGGRGGRDQHVEALEGAVEILLDQRADLLLLEVVGVVIGG